MLTAQNIIDLSAKDIGVLASGESLQPEEYVDCLTKLNAMLQSWDAMRLNIFAVSEATYPLTPNQYIYTIGLEGSPNYNAARPISIRAANIISATGGYRFALQVISVEEWAAIPEQGGNTATLPRKLYYDNDYPEAKIYLSPTPSAAATLELFTWEQLVQFSSLSQTFDLPPAYQNAIEWSLAVDLLDMFGRPPTQTIMMNAEKYMNALQGLNLPPSPGQSQEAMARMKAVQGVSPSATPEAVQAQ